jgi:cytosine/adenosine deaminase-related metal-dependent hydrolase
MTLYLTNARYVDWQSLDIRTACLRVDEGPGAGLEVLGGLPAGAPQPGDRVIDARNRLVTRAFGCGHHHIYSTLARGMPAPPRPPRNFVEVLELIWWRLDRSLDLEMVEASALAAALAMAKNGVTFAIDHHSSPHAVPGSLFTIARAFDQVGIGHMLCLELSDRDGEAIRDQGLAETDQYLASGRPGHVGLHASFTVGPELLGQAVDLARKHMTGIHIHVAEDQADQDITMARYGRRVVDRLFEAGALDLEKSILSHCLHLSDAEKDRIRSSGVWAAQNTESNLNNNVGLTGYKAITPNVILGTDGMHSDMIRSAHAAFLNGQAAEGLGFDEAYRRFRAIHRYAKEFGGPVDGENNLVILDYDAPTPVTSENFLGHFIYGFENRHVHTVIANGRVIVDNRRLTTVNEAEILARAREAAGRLWKKMNIGGNL